MTSMRALIVALSVATLVPCGAPAWAAAAGGLPAAVTSVEGITEYRLANGLQVLLAPDDSKPTTTVNLTVRVGSRHENYGETGMAHLLEHMVFKGTPTTRHALGEFTKRGLNANGSTWLDRTNYFASFAANEDNLRWYLSWQADAMVNSFIAKEDLDTEMTVVRNEMEMGENSPFRNLFEKTLATAYQWHNYGKSTIGARSDVENVDVGRLKDFYRTYYQPDNATLIVTGQFDPARTMAMIQESFGRLPKPQRALPRLYTIDPVQDGERSVVIRRVGGNPMLAAAYHVPPGAHPDYAAVELVASVLGDAPAGRLHKRLVETGRATESFSFAIDAAEPGIAMIGLQLGATQDPDAVKADMLDTIEGLAASPITEEEFRRAQVKWLKGWERRFTDPQAVGVALSEFVAQGDWRLFFLARDRVRDLSLADLQRVAADRFVRSNRTLAVYVPTDKPRRAPAPAVVDVAAQMKAFKPQPAAAAVPPFDASPAHIDRQTQRYTLSQGMKLALLPKPTRGQAVHAGLSLRFGDARSLAGRTEAAEMVAALLDKGTATLSRQQVQDRLDALRTELSVQGGPEGVTVALQTRREHLNDAVALVAEMLRRPALPEAVFEELRRQSLAEVQSQRDDPDAQLESLLARTGNPYPRGDVRHARNFDEMEADLKALTLAQVRDFHRSFYGADHAEFAAVGDFDVESLRRTLQSALGDWKSAAPYARVPSPLYARTAPRQVLATPDKQNAVFGIRLSVPLSDNDADYPAFMLANHILGGGGDSRLWQRVREREGLSYDVRSQVGWSRHEAHSVWMASAIFAPANLGKVETAMREEIDRALREGFSADEVQSAKRSLLSFRRLSRAQDRALAGALAGNLELGRSFAVSQKVDDALAALTPAQVNAALRKYLKPAEFAQAAAGDFKQP